MSVTVYIDEETKKCVCWSVGFIILIVCCLTFGARCLHAEDRLKNKDCQWVVSDAAAVVLIIVGSLAIILFCLCCGCCLLHSENSQESSRLVSA